MVGEKLKLCVVGCGMIGRIHAQAAERQRDHIQLFLCDTDTERVRALAEEVATAGTPAWRSALSSLGCVIEGAEIRGAQLHHRVRRLTRDHALPLLPVGQVPHFKVDPMPLGRAKSDAGRASLGGRPDGPSTGAAGVPIRCPK